MQPLTTLAEAQQKILNAVQPITATETIPLANARGRTLGETIHCPIDLPPFRSSAMDGYAFQKTGLTYQQAGSSFAGHPFQSSLHDGECVRIFTGAMIPENADTVAPQESVRIIGDQIYLQDDLSIGSNVRPQGLDRQAGEILLPSGIRLTPACIGLLASAGVQTMACISLVKVALMTTGDELISNNDPSSAGCIYESSLPMLAALLEPMPCRIVAQIHLKDQKEEILTELKNLANKAEVVIVTGGMSVGDSDFVRPALAAHGNLEFWRIALKPGMPMAFSHIQQAAIFGLPGNPVSTFVTFTELVAPALAKISGARVEKPIRFQARLNVDINRDSDRTELQRGLLEYDAEGQAIVSPCGNQRSNRIGSLAEANCYIILEQCSGDKKSGEQVLVQPLQAYT